MPISQEGRYKSCKLSQNPEEPLDLKAIYEKVKKKENEK